MATSSKKQTKKPPVTYLVCVSDADYSKVALDYACSLTKRKKGRLIVLHITEPVDYQGFGVVANKMQAENEKHAKKLLRNLAKEIDVDPILVHKEGFIEKEIIKMVEEHEDIDMLIVGAAFETSSKNKTLQPLVSQIGQKILVPMVIVPGNLTVEQIDALSA
tara:strand:- start:390 stop:875 length:486 start_codon:yes stop_codon:yes gene_type:complete